MEVGNAKRVRVVVVHVHVVAVGWFALMVGAVVT